MDLCLECASSWEMKPVSDTQSEAFLTSLLESMEPVFDGIIIGIMMIQSLHAVGYLRLSVNSPLTAVVTYEAFVYEMYTKFCSARV